MYKANGGKQILKIFPEQEETLKKYIKENNLDVYKPDELAKLVKYCNELIH